MKLLRKFRRDDPVRGTCQYCATTAAAVYVDVMVAPGRSQTVSVPGVCGRPECQATAAAAADYARQIHEQERTTA